MDGGMQIASSGHSAGWLRVSVGGRAVRVRWPACPGLPGLDAGLRRHRDSQSRDHLVRDFGSATPPTSTASTTSLKKHMRDAMRGHSAMGRG